MGEKWVQDWLEASGRKVYVPGVVGSHPIDFVVVEPSGQLWACDVKTYPRRARYPDTGIDIPDWHKYAQISAHCPVRLFFVDVFERYCYSIELSKARPHARRYGGKMYVPLSVARVEFKLSHTQVEQLRTVTNSTADYSSTVPYFIYSNST